LKGILAVICGLYSFIWGWMHVKDEGLKLKKRDVRLDRRSCLGNNCQRRDECNASQWRINSNRFLDEKQGPVRAGLCFMKAMDCVFSICLCNRYQLLGYHPHHVIWHAVCGLDWMRVSMLSLT